MTVGPVQDLARALGERLAEVVAQGGGPEAEGRLRPGLRTLLRGGKCQTRGTGGGQQAGNQIGRQEGGVGGGGWQ